MQVISWTFDQKMKAKFNQIYLHNDRRTFLHAVHVDEEVILLSIAGFRPNTNYDKFEINYISRKISFIRHIDFNCEI